MAGINLERFKFCGLEKRGYVRPKQEANYKHNSRKKGSDKDIYISIWSSIHYHWHEEKAAIEAHTQLAMTCVCVRGICTTPHKQHQVHKEVVQLTRARQTKPKEKKKKSVETM